MAAGFWNVCSKIGSVVLGVSIAFGLTGCDNDTDARNAYAPLHLFDGVEALEKDVKNDRGGALTDAVTVEKVVKDCVVVSGAADGDDTVDRIMVAFPKGSVVSSEGVRIPYDIEKGIYGPDNQNFEAYDRLVKYGKEDMGVGIVTDIDTAVEKYGLVYNKNCFQDGGKIYLMLP